MSGETEASVATRVALPSCRMIIQQCLSAKLEVRQATADRDAEFVQVIISRVSLRVECGNIKQLS